MVSNTSGAAEAMTGTPATGSFPLFFQKPVPLELKHHAKAGVSTAQDFSFARTTNSILINGVEFIEAAKYYPIIFTQTELPLPAVILGLERQNYFVDDKGRWKADTYIPAYVRKYPFVFMDASERKQLVLCIDEAAPQYKKSGGKNTLPLYDGDTPSKMTQHALEFCTAYHNHHLLTRRFCEDVKAADLLMPSQSNIKLASGRAINLGNFQVLDEKKLNALPDEKILEFHKKGFLPLIYLALASATQWQKLADMAGARESN